MPSHEAACGARIERQVGDARDQVAAAALHERVQPRHELRERERLRQVVVSTGREAGEPVGEGVARR